MFPYPSGRIHIGPCAQLHDGRRGGALQGGAGLQRAAPDGLGRLRHAGRERRDRARRPPRDLDLREHRPDEGADEAVRLLDRLEPRVRDLRSRILRPAAAAVPRHARRGPRHPQGGGGELGPGRHDRARQRAGDRRPRLALRRAGRAARADPVVLPHLRHGRRAARRARRARGLARQGPADAAQLDRQEPRPAVPLRDPRRAGGLRDARGLHDAARHDLRRELRRGLARPPAGAGAGGATRRSPPSSPSAARIGTSRGGARDGREARHRHRRARRPPVRPELGAAGLRRELRADGLRHRRDLRLSGARPARPRLRAEVRPRRGRGGQPRGTGLRRRRRRVHRSGQADQLALSRRPRRRRGQGRGDRPHGGGGPGRGRDALPAARLGRSAASATGAVRSRWCTARPAASCPSGARTCRSGCPRTSSFDGHGNPLERHPTWSRDDLPVLRRRRRGARPTRWTPSSTRRGTSPASPRRARRGRPTSPRPPTG